MDPTTAPAAQGPAASFLAGPIGSLLPFILIIPLFYFLMIRPQQAARKRHLDMINSVKRGDTVVMSSGIVGKVTKVEDAHVEVEIAANTRVRVVKATLADVVNPNAKPAND